MFSSKYFLVAAIAIEVALVFILSVLGNKVADNIELSTSLLIPLTILSLLALTTLIYFRYRKLSPAEKQVGTSTPKWYFSADERQKKEKRENTAFTIAFTIGCVGSGLTVPLIWFVSSEWDIALWFLLLIVIHIVASIPVLIISESKGRTLLFEIFAVPFAVGMLSPFAVLAALLIMKAIMWLFGIQPPN